MFSSGRTSHATPYTVLEAKKFLAEQRSSAWRRNRVPRARRGHFSRRAVPVEFVPHEENFGVRFRRHKLSV